MKLTQRQEKIRYLYRKWVLPAEIRLMLHQDEDRQIRQAIHEKEVISRFTSKSVDH